LRVLQASEPIPYRQPLHERLRRRQQATYR
jgi:hypothetical protein